MWTDPGWFIHQLEVWICSWSSAACPPTFLYLSFSTLLSSSLWRTDKIVWAKSNIKVETNFPRGTTNIRSATHTHVVTHHRYENSLFDDHQMWFCRETSRWHHKMSTLFSGYDLVGLLSKMKSYLQTSFYCTHIQELYTEGWWPFPLTA